MTKTKRIRITGFHKEDAFYNHKERYIGLTGEFKPGSSHRWKGYYKGDFRPADTKRWGKATWLFLGVRYVEI